jgi:hypothetical protein
MDSIIQALKGKKSYLVAGFAGLTWVLGEVGLVSPEHVDQALKLGAMLFGATLAAKVNRIRAALGS